MTQWFNADGLLVETARSRRRKTNAAKQVVTAGHIQELKIPFNLALLGTGTAFTTDRNNDGTMDGFNTGDAFIPAKSTILSAEVFVDGAATGGTSLSVGTYQVNGTAISATGLVNAALTAALTANTRVAGAGALINTTVTVPSYVAFSAAGTFTGGTGYILVRYANGAGV